MLVAQEKIDFLERQSRKTVAMWSGVTWAV